MADLAEHFYKSLTWKLLRKSSEVIMSLCKLEMIRHLEFTD